MIVPAPVSRAQFSPAQYLFENLNGGM